MSDEPLPQGYTFGTPRFVRTDDCMGAPCEYWTVDARSFKGDILMGNGQTKEEAVAKVIQNVRDHAAFWSQNPEQRLFAHIANAKKQGRFYDKDLVDVIEILAKKLFPNEGRT